MASLYGPTKIVPQQTFSLKIYFSSTLSTVKLNLHLPNTEINKIRYFGFRFPFCSDDGTGVYNNICSLDQLQWIRDRPSQGSDLVQAD